MNYFDTHCHLDFKQFEKDIDKVIERAKDFGVEYIINVGTDIESSKKVVEISKKYDFIFASIGIHPLDVGKFKISDLKEIEKIAKNEKVVAIGETGIDLYYSKENKEKQIEFFKGFIEIAGKLNLPLIVHQRESKDDIIDVIEKIKMPSNVVFHCFGGDIEFAKYCESKNFYISFTGIITFKNAERVREIAKIYPIEKIMAETDAPFLAPVPFRGKRNEPFMVKYIVDQISKIKKTQTSEILFNNSLTFFKPEDPRTVLGKDGPRKVDRFQENGYNIFNKRS